MPPKFGTSGLRGLVTDLTPALVADHVRAFLRSCPTGRGLFVARDLRPSSPQLADTVIATARQDGIACTDLGPVPTPALALAALHAGAAAIMVTGSHIPADRNGLKFYLPSGEITKDHEAAILAALGGKPGDKTAPLFSDTTAGTRWMQRYVTAFGPGALQGLSIGLWSHSAVSRDLLAQALHALGATVTELGRSDSFIPVDTEAVPDSTRAQIRAWVRDHRLDALVSTDGDGDRPLLADETGEVVAGDLLGQITARVIGASTVVTPLTSNSGVESGGHFDRVIRTRIGSPFVIAGMEQAGGRVAGYEANGGFLLGFDATVAGPLPALATRDSLLPLVATLWQARTSGTLSARIAAEPRRFTAADRIEGIDPAAAKAWLDHLATDPQALTAFVSGLGEAPSTLDLADGLRIHCRSGSIAHLRPSGNAPELRAYAEADSQAKADTLLHAALKAARHRF